MKISLKIENCYELYDTVITTITDTEVPDFPHHGRTGDIDDWWYDNIYCLTGVGHEDGDSYYKATITACDDPALVGREMEWGL